MKDIKLRAGIIIFTGSDMISKYFFYNRQYLNHTLYILPILNKGISRSLPVPFIIIMIISILGMGIFIRLFTTKKINRIITTLLIAGTLGNMIDRVLLGGVRDFINIRLFNFPIFNLADMMLSIGVVIRFARVMLEKKK
ncbi:MAG: signal peptidase II [bacterium]